MRLGWQLLLPVGAVAMAAVSACGASGSNEGQNVPLDGPDATADDTGSFFLPGDDGSGSFGDGSGGTEDDSGLKACATETQQAKQLPLDLFIMEDTSGSMSTRINATTSKWTAVKQALTAFFQDPASAGIGVGLQFFPLNQANVPATCTDSAQCGGDSGPCTNKACAFSLGGLQFCARNQDCLIGNCDNIYHCQNDPNYFCSNLGGACGNDANGFPLGNCVNTFPDYCSNADSCMVADYQTPAVAIAPLPGANNAQTTALVNALSAKSPTGNTPTSAALQGAINAAKAYATANSGHTVVAVLATDGLPTKCDTDIGHIANIAAQGLFGTPSIKTFVIGVFAPADQQTATSNLNQIANAGGTSTAFIINTTQNVSQAFLQALNQIRGSALPCDYSIPTPDGGTPDYGKVNVQFTKGSGGKTTILNVKDASACDPGSGGWYYDIDPSDGGTPTKITLCPASCQSVKSDPQGKVDVLLGCKTITSTPK